MKIPFSIKYRPQIESGEYKVETRDGKPVRIICWDRAPKFGDGFDLTLCVLIPLDKGEGVYYYNHSGKSRLNSERFNLFIVTPEEELTEFEKKLQEVLFEHATTNSSAKEKAHQYSSELLTIAKQQLIQSGELLTQEHHEKLMETQYNDTLEGVKKNWHDYFTPQAVTDIYNAGRNDALKDLPRWRKDFEFMGVREPEIVGPWLCYKKNRIVITDLEKLPGFKEDEK